MKKEFEVFERKLMIKTEELSIHNFTIKNDRVTFRSEFIYKNGFVIKFRGHTVKTNKELLYIVKNYKCIIS